MLICHYIGKLHYATSLNKTILLPTHFILYTLLIVCLSSCCRKLLVFLCKKNSSKNKDKDSIMTIANDLQPPETVKVHDLETTICWIHDGIFWVKLKKNEEHTVAHAKEQIAIVQNYTLNENLEKMPIICDVREGIPIKKDVRDFYNSPEAAKNSKQFAFIVQSAVSKVVANFFIQQRKLKLPVKMFTEVSLAHEWCKS